MKLFLIVLSLLVGCFAQIEQKKQDLLNLVKREISQSKYYGLQEEENVLLSVQEKINQLDPSSANFETEFQLLSKSLSPNDETEVGDAVRSVEKAMVRGSAKSALKDLSSRKSILPIFSSGTTSDNRIRAETLRRFIGELEQSKSKNNPSVETVVDYINLLSEAKTLPGDYQYYAEAESKKVSSRTGRILRRFKRD